MWVRRRPAPPGPDFVNNPNVQPVTITSEYAEIIYFLRNGNLYRRVLLVAPQLQSTIYSGDTNNVTLLQLLALPPQPRLHAGNPVTRRAIRRELAGRQRPLGTAAAVRDMSAASNSGQTIVLNTLGDLTNRENRFASPRFADDFLTLTASTAAHRLSTGPDGISDDLNSDNVPDLLSDALPRRLQPGPPRTVTGPGRSRSSHRTRPERHVREPRSTTHGLPLHFSRGLLRSLRARWQYDAYGWIHSPMPSANVPQAAGATAPRPNSTPARCPISRASTTTRSTSATTCRRPTTRYPSGRRLAGIRPGGAFPTWRETLSPSWNDPTVQVNVATTPAATNSQPNGLAPRPTNTDPVADDEISAALDGLPMRRTARWLRLRHPRPSPVPASSATPSATTTMSLFLQQGSARTVRSALAVLSWEDDLIMTGVRASTSRPTTTRWPLTPTWAGATTPLRLQRLVPDITASGTFLAGNSDYSREISRTSAAGRR